MHVQGVKSLKSQLESPLLSEEKIFVERQVHVPVAVAAEYMPACIAAAVDRRAGRRHETRRIEPAGGARVGDVRIAPGYDVSTAARSGIRWVTGEQGRVWKSA